MERERSIVGAGRRTSSRSESLPALLDPISADGLRTVIELAPIAIGLVDLEGRTLLANRALRDFVGYTDDELAERTLESITHPDDVAETQVRFAELLAGERDRFELDQRYLHRDGHVVWGRIMVALLRDESGVPAVAIGMTEDITERHELEEQLRAAEATYRLLVEESPAVVYVAQLDLSLPWRYVSPVIERLVGVTAEEWLADPGLWWGLMSELDRPGIERAVAVAVRTALHPDGGDPEVLVLHYRMRRRGGGECWIRDESRIVRDTDGELVFRGMLIDVTREKALEADLERQALHDPLTDLANRQLFADRIEHAMARRQRDQPNHDAIVFVDLDDFKTVNDSLGHAAGDDLIRSVAARLRGCLRPVDTAGRLGGDEFALLLEGLGDPVEALAVAERAQGQIERPHRLGGKLVTTSASLGIAYLQDAPTVDIALRNADLAMYRAKALGKGRIATYDPSLHSSAVRRLDIRSALDTAVENDELEVHLQPVVDMATGQVTAVEGLLRWTHPVFGALPPVEFVPIAEETGAIVPIGMWVVGEVATWLAEQHARGLDHLSASVNLSPIQLRDGRFVDHVARVLERTGLPPASLVFEITEQALMAERAWRELEALHALGVRLAVDDFGTGYASLAYLSRLAVDVLKIDRTFVEQLDGGERRRAVPQAIGQLAASLGLATIAEGIETVAQRDELQGLGCRHGQGYLFAPPAPPAEAHVLVGSTLGPPVP